MATEGPDIILISPTEPPAIRGIGRTSSIPERFGVDVLFVVEGQRVGMQRKEITDLVASVYDGRLGREISLMKQLPVPVVVIEGRPTWTDSGELIHRGMRFTREQMYGLVYSLEMVHNIYVAWTVSESDTAAAVKSLQKWLKKKEHKSLLTRPKPTPPWTTRTSRDWGVFLLQSFPGIGVTLAGNIFDCFGKVPLRWECSKEELLEVEGLGPKRVEELLKAFGGGER